MIKVKRAYDDASGDDGFRVLVERLWPRGITKERAALDLWLKDVAPSTELRKWFHGHPGDWEEFRERYWHELAGKKDDIDLLKRKADEGTVTFVYSAREREHNTATELKAYIEQRVRGLEKRQLKTAH